MNLWDLKAKSFQKKKKVQLNSGTTTWSMETYLLTPWDWQSYWQNSAVIIQALIYFAAVDKAQTNKNSKESLYQYQSEIWWQHHTFEGCWSVFIMRKVSKWLNELKAIKIFAGKEQHHFHSIPNEGHTYHESRWTLEKIFNIKAWVLNSEHWHQTTESNRYSTPWRQQHKLN